MASRAEDPDFQLFIDLKWLVVTTDTGGLDQKEGEEGTERERRREGRKGERLALSGIKYQNANSIQQGKKKRKDFGLWKSRFHCMAKNRFLHFLR